MSRPCLAKIGRQRREGQGLRGSTRDWSGRGIVVGIRLALIWYLDMNNFDNIACVKCFRKNK